jgi:hypothetical protein
VVDFLKRALGIEQEYLLCYKESEGFLTDDLFREENSGSAETARNGLTDWMKRYSNEEC